MNFLRLLKCTFTQVRVCKHTFHTSNLLWKQRDIYVVRFLCITLDVIIFSFLILCDTNIVSLITTQGSFVLVKGNHISMLCQNFHNNMGWIIYKVTNDGTPLPLFCVLIGLQGKFLGGATSQCHKCHTPFAYCCCAPSRSSFPFTSKYL